MSDASHNFAETGSPIYISKTEAVYENRSNYSVISRLVKEGKIGIHLVEGRIMLNRDEASREITKFKNRPVARPAVNPTLFD